MLIMRKYITGKSRFLYMALLVATLILPTGMNKRAMADTGLKINDHKILCDQEITGDKEEDYPNSLINFIDRI